MILLGNSAISILIPPPPQLLSSFLCVHPVPVPDSFCLFDFWATMPSSLCEAEWLSVFCYAMPWPVGVFGNKKGGWVNWLSMFPPTSVPRGVMWWFQPGVGCTLNAFLYNCTAHVYAHSKKKKITLSTNPEVAEQSVMVKIRGQTWADELELVGWHPLWLGPVSFTEHEFTATRNCSRRSHSGNLLLSAVW